MVCRTKKAVQNFFRWVVGASRKVAKVVLNPFSSFQPSLKYTEQKREYFKDCPNVSLYSYLFKLGRNKRSELGKKIKCFIESIKKSKETDPLVIMTDIRNFMNDMKNYIIANCDTKFDREVAKSKANGPKPFNLDEILENVVVELVLVPLKDQLFELISNDYKNSLPKIMEHMYFLRSLSVYDINLQAAINQFSEEEIGVLSENFYLMQVSELPSEKLKHFREGLSNIFKFTKSRLTGKRIQIGADDVVPLLAWVFAKCRTFTCEVEGLYMWYLMNPSLKNGETGYYITSMLCASALLKDPRRLHDNCDPTDPCPCGSPNCDLQSVYQLQPPLLNIKLPIFESDCKCKDFHNHEIKVVYLDDFTGLPMGTHIIKIQPNLKAKDVCSIMAKKLHVKHPEFFGLYVLHGGRERLLRSNDCPGQVQENVREICYRRYCIFMYKETTRKLRWPFISI